MGTESREVLDRRANSSAVTIIERIADLIQAGTIQQEARLGQVFGKPEQLLLNEARERFDFEQKSAATLHSKSTLFLSISGVFAALITASIGRLLDRSLGSFLEIAALGVLLLSLGLLTVAAILLGRSALSRAYQVTATPSHWLKHLANLRQVTASTPDPEAVIFIRLQQDFLDAWVEAAEACCAANEAKASVLDLVQKLLYVVISITFIGILLLILQKAIY